MRRDTSQPRPHVLVPLLTHGCSCVCFVCVVRSSLLPSRARHTHPTPPQGLSKAEAKRRLDAFGPNELDKDEPPSLIEMVIDQFKDLIVGLLCAAAALSLYTRVRV